VLVALIKVVLAKPPPLLCTIHGGDWYTAPFLAPLKRWTINQSQAIAVVSSALQKEIPKAIVAPMGIDCKNRFLPGATTRALSELLFVGSIVPKKGLLMLIDALALALKKQPALHLTIVGDGPEKEKAQKRAYDLGILKQVHFLGALPNAALPFYYQRAGLFIAPSVAASNGDREGLGLVVAESLACLCPVVVSSTEAFQDLVIPNESGLVFAMGNALDLAEKILWACSHPEVMQKMAQKGYAKVRENFSWEKVSTHYSNILRTL
jgi:glycosyltransferase involved in cell wall biosynthesis